MSVRRILVVDDSRTICLLLEAELTRLGYVVAATHSMEDAISLCERQSFDLVLVDLILPGMGGLKGIPHLRRLWPRMPVIAMTGGGDAGSVRKRLHEARVVGADALLGKPFDLAALETTVKAHIMPFDARDRAVAAPRKVLVIDDSATMCMIILQMLGQYGYQATAVRSMEEAFASPQIVRVDVIVTDIFMPGKGGIQGISEIRQMWPTVKIVAMSGGARDITGDKVLKAARRIGADVTLQKPFDAMALVSSIETLFADPLEDMAAYA